jgi:uncharacterized protein YjbJ (UPF0337 family)
MNDKSPVKGELFAPSGVIFACSIWPATTLDRLLPYNAFIKEHHMSSTSDKIKGAANEAIGNAKQAAGKAVGNDRLQAKGIIQERKGEAQQAIGKAKAAVKKVIDRV